MTGAPIPPGADAVVMVERTKLVPGDGSLGRVRIAVDPLPPGQNIMRRASSMLVEMGHLGNSRQITPGV